MTTIPPLRREVLVRCDPATAERLWVDEIDAWWPIASHGCFGAGASVAFEADEIVETSPTGERAVWGRVTDRAPGRLSFTWHPGHPSEAATRVTVTFTATDDGHTWVTLVHEGWERHPGAAGARADYAEGWVFVLGRLAAWHAGHPPRPEPTAS